MKPFSSEYVGKHWRIADKTGTPIDIPKAIRVTPVLANFVELTKEEVLAMCDERAVTGFFPVSAEVRPDHRAHYKAILWDTPKTLAVVIKTSGIGRSTSVGWAHFDRRKSTLVEVSAALLPEHRGHGLYPTILQRLTRYAGTPYRVVRSDQEMTVQGILSWMKAGHYDESLGRYKTNPRQARGRRPSVGQMRQAVRALLTRAATA